MLVFWAAFHDLHEYRVAPLIPRLCGDSLVATRTSFDQAQLYAYSFFPAWEQPGLVPHSCPTIKYKKKSDDSDLRVLFLPHSFDYWCYNDYRLFNGLCNGLFNSIGFKGERSLM